MIQVLQCVGSACTITTAVICGWMALDLHKRTRMLERKLGELLHNERSRTT